MFYINSVYGGREPYRVQEIQKDRQGGGQGSPEHQFDQDEAETREKFRKASKKFYKKTTVVLASEIMNKQLLELEEGLSVKQAWEKIKSHEIKHYPIVNEEGKFKGMLSEGEILRTLQSNEEMTLKEITSKHTLCAEPHTELADVVEVFSDQKIEAVPVVDDKEKAIGILTQNDLLQTMMKITSLDKKGFL